LPLWDPTKSFERIDYKNGQTPSRGSGYIGTDPDRPEAIVAANGGSDLIYLPRQDARDVATSLIENLMKQDYVSGLFVNDRLGKLAGTLPMSAIHLLGMALTPQPDIVVNFRSFSTSCADRQMCTAEIADTPLDTGQGMHGSFSRAETRNFMAAIGPDFRSRFADPAPVSNADIAPTLARIAGFELPSKGKLIGRVITEALNGGAPVRVEKRVIESEPDESGLRTLLQEQSVEGTRYFDAAGFPGRTVGLESPRRSGPGSRRARQVRDGR